MGYFPFLYITLYHCLRFQALVRYQKCCLLRISNPNPYFVGAEHGHVSHVSAHCCLKWIEINVTT